MNNILNETNQSNAHPEANILKRIFDTHCEETISDEQVKRMLEPILKMIEDGEFDKDKQKRKATWERVTPLAAPINKNQTQPAPATNERQTQISFPMKTISYESTVATIGIYVSFTEKDDEPATEGR